VLAETLAWLAEKGAKRVVVLASDRPAMIREAVGQGEAWGMQIEVLPERHELTAEEARRKYHDGDAASWLPAPLDIVALDEWPGDASIRWWQGYGSWLDGSLALIPRAAVSQVGVRVLAPGVHVGLRSQVAANARLIPPCWVGAQAWVGPGAVVGPRAIIEDEAYVDEGTTVTEAVVGPHTYVGAWTSVSHSLAYGQDLVSLTTGHRTRVTDPLLLGELRQHSRRERSTWVGRLMAFIVLVVTSPVVLWAAWKKRKSSAPLFVRATAVRGGQGEQPDLEQQCTYYRLAGVTGVAARWPQLWSVVQGNFAWVGNRPLTREEAATLRSEVERLWLTAPIGVIALADAVGAPEGLHEDTRSHACYYAVTTSWASDLRILWQWLADVLMLGNRKSRLHQPEPHLMKTETRGSTLFVEGLVELGSTTAGDFHEKIKGALTTDHHTLDIDMSQLRFMDSTGLGVLASLHNMLSDRQGRVRILHPSPPAQQILELTRMHTVFEIVKKD
jgi:anti-anti-sigma factor